MQFGLKLVINPACQGHKFCVWRFTRISIPRFCLFSMFHSYCSPYALNQDSFCVWCRLQACLTLACLACGFPIVLLHWLPTQTNGLINWAVLLLLLINMWDGFIAQPAEPLPLRRSRCSATSRRAYLCLTSAEVRLTSRTLRSHL